MLSVSFYNVSITNLTGSAPADGFIDNTKIEQYITDLTNPPSNFSLVLSTAKRRGNLRYAEIIRQLELITNVFMTEMVATNADAKTEANPFKFTVWVQQDSSLITADELNAGAFLTGAAAITRAVARAMIADYTVNIDVYDPTTADSIGVLGATTSAVRYGSVIAPVHVGQLTNSLTTAASHITTTQVASSLATI